KPGRHEYAFMSPAAARENKMAVLLAHRLRTQDRAGDLSLFFQPMVAFFDSKMVGAECLVRWKDEELGDVSSKELVRIAADGGLLPQLGTWVLRGACAMRRDWRALDLAVPRLSIDVTWTELDEPTYVDRVLETLAEFDVAPNEIAFEITGRRVLEGNPIG